MEYALVLVWLLTALGLGVVGAPVAALLFPRFEDRGAGLALPLVLAVIGVVAYWVGRVAFGWPALLAGLGLVAGAAVFAVRRGVDLRWDRATEVAAVFTLAFGLLIAVRAVDPSAWPGGGEKFLDFGLLASLFRAGTLPPEDHWFAGEPVQYYYGGHMLMSLLARLTFTDPVYAYNTALALVYGAYVTAAYSLAGNLAAARDRSFTAAGTTAALLVGFASNLAPAVRFVGWLVPEPTGHDLVGLFGLSVQGSHALGPDHFDYWIASRIIPWTINEFPLFAFLNGDLHAHMMSPPLLLLAAGLLFAYYLAPASAVWRRRALVLGAVPPVAGLVAVVNTWSFPTVGGLTWLTLALAPAPPWTLLPAAVRGPVTAAVERRTADSGRRALRELARPVAALALAAVVLALGVAVAAPFFLGTATGRSVTFLPPPRLRSGVVDLLVVHGVFLLPTAAYFWDRLRGAFSWRDWANVALATAAVLAVTFPRHLAGFALLGPVLAVAWYLRRTDRVGFEGVLISAATGLILLVEVAYVADHSPWRFNTVFKVYAQVWALWGVAGGVALADVARLGPAAAAVRESATAMLAAPDATRTDGSGVERGTALRALFGVALLLSVSVYGGLAMRQHFGDETGSPALDEPTLNARHFLAEHHPREQAAIEWLADREGQPNIVTAPGRHIYQWVNGPSSLTGVPTVAGWAHERGYRSPAAYERRADDVERLFTGNETERARLLAEYDVKYIYVGPVEKRRYATADLEFGDEPGIERYREFGGVVIYRVNRSALAT